MRLPPALQAAVATELPETQPTISCGGDTF